MPPPRKEPDHASFAPRVSVGMPVYNSARWIEASLESILAQTCGDFELIISDNASTDDTVAICERYARRDPRVRIIRQVENRGANENYMAVLQGARGEYFKWASSNDVCAPTFIEKCVAALDSEPEAVLACPRSRLFDTSLEASTYYDHDIELQASSPASRFLDLQNGMGLNNAMNGVIRREALLRASRLGNFLRADLILMSELSLLGKFLLLDEHLFYRRMSPESATRLKNAREVELHHVPSAKAPLRWQYWRYQFALLRTSRLVRFLSQDWFRVLNYSLRTLVWLRAELARDFMQSIRGAGAR